MFALFLKDGAELLMPPKLTYIFLHNLYRIHYGSIYVPIDICEVLSESTNFPVWRNVPLNELLALIVICNLVY